VSVPTTFARVLRMGSRVRLGALPCWPEFPFSLSFLGRYLGSGNHQSSGRRKQKKKEAMEAAAPAAAGTTTAAAAFTGEYACVFCGSKEGQTPAFAAAAKGLANVLLQRGLGLVYGGGTVGLMGIVSRTVRLILLLLLTRARVRYTQASPPPG
jgi:hypothetical protein